MNKLTGIIKDVVSSAYMALIIVDHQGDVFSAAIQETPAGAARFKKGSSVTLVFKETEVAVAVGLGGKISIRNRASAIVKAVETAGVLSRIVLDYKGQRIASVITSTAAECLELKPGDDVEWLVKANEMSLIGAIS